MNLFTVNPVSPFAVDEGSLRKSGETAPSASGYANKRLLDESVTTETGTRAKRARTSALPPREDGTTMGNKEYDYASEDTSGKVAMTLQEQLRSSPIYSLYPQARDEDAEWLLDIQEQAYARVWEMFGSMWLANEEHYARAREVQRRWGLPILQSNPGLSSHMNLMRRAAEKRAEKRASSKFPVVSE